MVYVTGDLHGGMDIQKLRDWGPDRAPTRSDYLIAAGGFGHLWDSRFRATGGLIFEPAAGRIRCRC